MSDFISELNRVLYTADQSTAESFLSQLASPEHAHTRVGSAAGDRTFRLVAADAIQDNGRDEEADLLRQTGHPIAVHDGRVESLLSPDTPMRWLRAQDGRFQLHQYRLLQSDPASKKPSDLAMSVLQDFLNKGRSPERQMVGRWQPVPLPVYSNNPSHETGVLKHVPVNDNWAPEENTGPFIQDVAYQRDLDRWKPIHEKMRQEVSPPTSS